jgi:hypothetical protein
MQPAAHLSPRDNSGPHVWHSLVGQALSMRVHAYFTDIESTDRSSESRLYAQQWNKRQTFCVHCMLFILIYLMTFRAFFSDCRHIVWNDGIVNNIQVQQSRSNWRSYPGICLEELRKSMVLVRRPNRGRNKYEVYALINRAHGYILWGAAWKLEPA